MHSGGECTHTGTSAAEQARERWSYHMHTHCYTTTDKLIHTETKSSLSSGGSSVRVQSVKENGGKEERKKGEKD